MADSGKATDRDETSGDEAGVRSAGPRRTGPEVGAEVGVEIEAPIGVEIEAPIGAAIGTQTGLRSRQKRTPSTWHARIFVFLSVGFLWIVLSWSLTFHHTLLLVLWPVSTLLVVWLSDQLGVVNDETTPLKLTFTTLAYVPWLAMQVVSSSLAVLRYAWQPRAERYPTTAIVSSRTRTELGLASFANSITLTPGTLSLEAESLTTARAKGGDSAWVLVHSLTPRGIEELREGAMDDRVVRVEAPLKKHLDAQQKRAEKKAAAQDGPSGGAGS